VVEKQLNVMPCVEVLLLSVDIVEGTLAVDLSLRLVRLLVSLKRQMRRPVRNRRRLKRCSAECEKLLQTHKLLSKPQDMPTKQLSLLPSSPTRQERLWKTDQRNQGVLGE